MSHTVFDWGRGDRTGVPEVVMAGSKTTRQLEALSDLPLNVDEHCGAATLFSREPDEGAPLLGIVSAGTSDLRVAAEVDISARFLGLRDRERPFRERHPR